MRIFIYCVLRKNINVCVNGHTSPLGYANEDNDGIYAAGGEVSGVSASVSVRVRVMR